MKITVKQLRTFLAFDAPLEMKYIGTRFTATHSQYQQLIPEWGYTSTRQKLIANYWFTDVVAHFAAMISLPLLVSWMLTNHFKSGYLLVVIIVVLFSFVVILVASYWPSFSSNFLPKLEAVVSSYQRKQQQRVVQQIEEQVAGYHEKVRNEQEQTLLQFRVWLAAQQQKVIQQLRDGVALLQESSIIEQNQIIEQFQTKFAEYQEKVIQQFQEDLATLLEQANNVQEVTAEQIRSQLSAQRMYLLEQQKAVQNRFQQQIALEKEKTGLQHEVIKKCRQAQLSNFALTLVYYALSKAAGNNTVESTDHTANLLLKLYGVDRGSLRTNLDLITGTGSKRKNLGERKCTEIRNRFDEARDFLIEMGVPTGESLLSDLELKILGS